jgi:hypothetical protein
LLAWNWNAIKMLSSRSMTRRGGRGGAIMKLKYILLFTMPALVAASGPLWASGLDDSYSNLIVRVRQPERFAPRIQRFIEVVDHARSPRHSSRQLSPAPLRVVRFIRPSRAERSFRRSQSIPIRRETREFVVARRETPVFVGTPEPQLPFGDRFRVFYLLPTIAAEPVRGFSRDDDLLWLP